MSDYMIAMDSKEGKSFGFTSDIFDDSWLWRKDKDIYFSMIIVREEMRNQGHTQQLVQNILDAGFTVKIPSPMSWMQIIVRKMGFERKDEDDPHFGMCEVWVKREKKED